MDVMDETLDDIPRQQGFDVEGWLEKKSSEGVLRYAESRELMGHPLGTIEVEKILSIEPVDPKTGGFKIMVPGRMYELCAGTETAMEHWISALRILKVKIATVEYKMSSGQEEDVHAHHRDLMSTLRLKLAGKDGSSSPQRPATTGAAESPRKANNSGDAGARAASPRTATHLIAIAVEEDDASAKAVSTESFLPSPPALPKARGPRTLDTVTLVPQLTQTQINRLSRPMPAVAAPAPPLLPIKSKATPPPTTTTTTITALDPKEATRNKRARVCSELVSTEMAYVDQLCQMKWCYQDPLTKTGVLDEESNRAVFGNLESLVQLHKQLLETFRNKLDLEGKADADFPVGAMLASISPVLTLYVDYVNRFHESGELLKRLNGKRQFAKVLSKCTHSSKLTGGFNALEILRVAPVQRLPRYVLLLKEVLRFTEVGHGDYEPCVKALAAMEKVANQINEKKREAENLQRLGYISQRVEGNTDALREDDDGDDESHLIRSHRKIVAEVALPWTCDVIRVPLEKRTLLLCNDSLCIFKVVAVPAEKFMLVDLIRWNHAMLNELAEPTMWSITRAFHASSRSNIAQSYVHTFRCSTAEDKRLWLDTCTRLMAAWREVQQKAHLILTQSLPLDPPSTAQAAALHALVSGIVHMDDTLPRGSSARTSEADGGVLPPGVATEAAIDAAEASPSLAPPPAAGLTKPATALYAYDGAEPGSIIFEEGDALLVINHNGNEPWCWCRLERTGDEGWAPVGFLKDVQLFVRQRGRRADETTMRRSKSSGAVARGSSSSSSSSSSSNNEDPVRPRRKSGTKSKRKALPEPPKKEQSMDHPSPRTAKKKEQPLPETPLGDSSTTVIDILKDIDKTL